MLLDAPPIAASFESPVAFADRVGVWYGERVTANHRRDMGLYLTPPAIAHFMARQLKAAPSDYCLLDPSAGAGILSCAVIEELASRENRPLTLRISACEIDPALATVLSVVLEHARAWAAERNFHVVIEVRNIDFVLAHADAVQPLGSFSELRPSQIYQGVIANPPYFKIAKSDPRSRACSALVHGQPNIYGLFMGVAGALLVDDGEFIFIVPRSFASGPYFSRFRRHFFSEIRLDLVHIFGSRRDAFRRDEVLQENVIVRGLRHDDWSASNDAHSVVLSTSAGVADLSRASRRSLPLRDILDMQDVHCLLRLPSGEGDSDILAVVDAWTGSLKEYGLRISTGPVVPFRATEEIDAEGDLEMTHVPLIWLVHVLRMDVEWPRGKRKRQYIKRRAADQKLLVPNRNYVLIRRFSAKEDARRLTAAPYLSERFDTDLLGIENHLNYIHRPGGELSRDEAFGLAALYNSSLLDTYFRAVNGNTQVSATELRSIPLPPRDIIEAIGRQAAASRGDWSTLDQTVNSFLKLDNAGAGADLNGDDRRGAEYPEGTRIAEAAAE